MSAHCPEERREGAVTLGLLTRGHLEQEEWREPQPEPPSNRLQVTQRARLWLNGFPEVGSPGAQDWEGTAGPQGQRVLGPWAQAGSLEEEQEGKSQGKWKSKSLLR